MYAEASRVPLRLDIQKAEHDPVLETARKIHQSLTANLPEGVRVTTLHNATVDSLMGAFPKESSEILTKQLEKVTDNENYSVILVDSGEVRELIIISRRKSGAVFGSFSELAIKVDSKQADGIGETLNVIDAPLKGGLVITKLSYYRDVDSYIKLASIVLGEIKGHFDDSYAVK
jgi:hypothetical protein